VRPEVQEKKGIHSLFCGKKRAYQVEWTGGGKTISEGRISACAGGIKRPRGGISSGGGETAVGGIRDKKGKKGMSLSRKNEVPCKVVVRCGEKGVRGICRSKGFKEISCFEGKRGGVSFPKNNRGNSYKGEVRAKPTSTSMGKRENQGSHSPLLE